MTVRTRRLLLLLAILPTLALLGCCSLPWINQLVFPWESRLASAVQGVDRIRVRSGGTCHRNLDREMTLFEERDPSEIAKLVESIRVDRWGSSVFPCWCCGEPSIEFYRGQELVLTLGFHHGRIVRWPGGWPGDALLSSESATYLKQWLAAHTVES